MAKVQLTVTIDRPVPDVFRVLSTPEITPRWSANAIEEHATTPGPAAVGSRRRAKVRRLGGGTTENEIEITEFEPNGHIAVRSIESVVPFTSSWSFAPAGDGHESRLALGLRRSGVAPSVGRASRGSVRADLSARPAAPQVDDGGRRALMPPRNGVAGWLRGLGWLLLLAAVGGCLPRQDQSASSTAPSNPPSGTSTDQPVASGTPRTSSADEIFDRVSPSVVFVATDIGTGSGLIVDDRHVVTNAHVVRPYAAARVRFGDGREVTAAPVVGWDLIADLAVLDVGLGLGRRPLMVSDAMPRTGARVYLVGYPLADMTSPTATITEGIISSAPFEWIDDLTFLQTDATIDDGQSGGVLVDADGRLLGITGASRGQFATAFEAHDGLARIDGLLAGEDIDGTGDHMLTTPGSNGKTDVRVTIRNRADAHVWVIEGKPGDPAASISMTSDQPVGLYGMAAAGKLGHGAGPPAKKLKLDLSFDAVGPYAVKIESSTGEVAEVTLRSTVGLTEVVDLDDGRTISTTEPSIGAADYAGDLDWYVLSLTKGEKATIRASAAAIDPALFIDRVGSNGPPLATGHDSGGPLGGDDLVEFTAPSTGEYLVVVSDIRFQGAGAYRLTVEAG